MKGNNLKLIQYGKSVIEQCDAININALMRRIKSLLEKELLRIELEGLGNNIKLTSSKTGMGGTRFWFICPQCKGRVGVLHRLPGSNLYQCRRCLGLQYGAAHYHRTPQEKHAKLIKKLLKMRRRGLI